MTYSNTNPELVFEILEKSKLNWTVQMQPLFLPNGDSTKFSGVVNTKTGQCYATAKAYQPLQNHELVETMVAAGMSLEVPDDAYKGGLLRQGALVYLQAELPEVHIGKSGMKRHLTMTNSHDLTTQVGFGTTNTVIICENTFHYATRAIQRFRHTASLKDRIQVAVKNLSAAMESENAMVDLFNAASYRTATKEAISKVTHVLLGVKATDTIESLTAQKQKKIVEWDSAIAKSFEEQGDTVWALFNAVTRYTNHVMRTKDDGSLFVGRGAKMNRRAYELLPEIVQAAPSTTWV